MQTSLDSICLIHYANPSAKAGICEPVSKTTDGIDDYQNRERWVSGEHRESNNMADRGEESNAPLTKINVNSSIDECGD